MAPKRKRGDNPFESPPDPGQLTMFQAMANVSVAEAAGTHSWAVPEPESGKVPREGFDCHGDPLPDYDLIEEVANGDLFPSFKTFSRKELDAYGASCTLCTPKHNGRTYLQVALEDPQYIEWVYSEHGEYYEYMHRWYAAWKDAKLPPNVTVPLVDPDDGKECGYERSFFFERKRLVNDGSLVTKLIPPSASAASGAMDWPISSRLFFNAPADPCSLPRQVTDAALHPLLADPEDPRPLPHPVFWALLGKTTMDVYQEAKRRRCSLDDEASDAKETSAPPVAEPSVDVPPPSSSVNEPPAEPGISDVSEIRALAIELVLANHLNTANGQLARLGVRAFPEASDSTMTYFRQMALLVHPDKNGNTDESIAAFKTLSNIKTSFRYVSVGYLKSFQED